MSAARENGFIYISINYIGKLYVSVELQDVFTDLNTNDFIDIKVSYEDAVMRLSLFNGSGIISFSFFKKNLPFQYDCMLYWSLKVHFSLWP